MAKSGERVALELCLCSGALDTPIAVCIHVLDPVAGTPTRSFTSRHRAPPSDSACSSASSEGRCPEAGVAATGRELAAAAEEVNSSSGAAGASASAAEQQVDAVPLTTVQAAAGASCSSVVQLDPATFSGQQQTEPGGGTAGSTPAACALADDPEAAALPSPDTTAGLKPADGAQAADGSAAGDAEEEPEVAADKEPSAPQLVPAAMLAPALPHTSATSSGSRGSYGGGGALPGGVEKLLALELEVVQLQQSLQIAQLEFETRTVQIHSLKQRADDAEQRAQMAEERASGLTQQLRQLERQAGDLQCQLGEAAARHQQDAAQLAARLAAAAAQQQADQQEAGRLRQQLAAARQAAQAEQAQLRRAAAVQRGEWEEQAGALRRENTELRSQVASACAALKAMGIPPGKVSGQPELAAAGAAAVVQSPPESPADAAALPSITVPRRPTPPQVPRLQLSSISLQALQAQASPKPQLAQAALACPGGQQSDCSAPPAMVGQLAGPAGAVSACVHMQHQQQHQQVVMQQQQQQQEEDMFAHVVVAADGAAALVGCPPRAAGAGACGGAAASATDRQGKPQPVEATPSPASSVQQNCDLNLPPLLTARRTVSPAQQELLATARQWQQSARSAAATAAAEEEEEDAAIPAYYPPPLPSARGSARGPAPPSLFAATRGGGMQQQQQRNQTPRPRLGAGAAGNSPLKGTPRAKLALRRTYGQDATFQGIKAAYNAVLSSEADRSSKWARSVFSSASAVDTDPTRVDHMVQGVLQLFASNGVPIPLRKCGQCQYRLGSAKLALRLVNGRLMARAGAGQTMDIFSWLEKQPAPPQKV